MSSSSLDPENMNAHDRQLGKGHGTRALGPSDTSDSGSDLLGADGMAQDAGLHFDTGTNDDMERSTARHTAGPDVGDANLDSDSDSAGTGEHATAGRDTMSADGRDIDVDHIEQVDEWTTEDMGEASEQDRLQAEGITGSDDAADAEEAPDVDVPDFPSSARGEGRRAPTGVQR